MCTSPRQLEKKFADGSSRVYLVPCGKCPECRAKYQSEYAALSVLEANSAGSLAFITFTYNDESLPVWYLRPALVRIDTRSDSDFSIYDAAGTGRGEGCYQWQLDKWKDSGCCLLPFDDDLVVCPSLNRADIKALLKKYRQDYFRRHGERLDLRMSCFGEYGERFHRPHYHMIVYGLSRDEVNRLAAKWSFGYTNVQYVTRFNADGSDAFIKVSRYVSKYVSKCEFLPDFVQRGFAESPRKQSSVRLGRRDLNYEHLRNFI